MDVSQQKTYNRTLVNATASGVIGFAMGAGFHLYKQRELLANPGNLDTLEIEIIQKEEKIKLRREDKKSYGFFEKVANFMDKRDLWVKKDAFKSISDNKKVSLTALSKYGGFVALDMVAISLAFDGIVKLFSSKGEQK